MTDHDKEMRMRISMLIDADLDGRDNPRLLDKLENETELRATWTRYNLIGDVLRSEGEPLAGSDFAARVSRLIAEEPTILSPRSIEKVARTRTSAVSLALAASLAVVAVLIGKSINDHAEFIQTATFGGSPAHQVASSRTEGGDNQADGQFNDYLVLHNETAYMAGSAGMLSYVRLAGPDR